MKIKALHKPEWDSTKRRWNTGNIKTPNYYCSTWRNCAFTPTRGIVKYTDGAIDNWKYGYFRKGKTLFNRNFRARCKSFVYEEMQRAMLELYHDQ